MRKGVLIGGVLGAGFAVLRVLFDDWNELSSLHPGIEVGLALGAAVGGGATAALIGLGIGWLYERGQPRGAGARGAAARAETLGEATVGLAGQMNEQPVNWRRGLRRTWTALSIIWALAFGLVWWLSLGRVPDFADWFAAIIIVLSLPVVTLVLGLTVWWIVAGFRRP